MAKNKSYLDIGFNEYLIKRENLDDQIKINKAIAEEEISELQKQKLEQEIELQKKRTEIVTGQNNINQSEQIQYDSAPSNLNANILRWEIFYLDLDTGQAVISSKQHKFQLDSSPYMVFKLLLQKRASSDDNEVTFEEFIAVTGMKDKDKIKKTIRQIRRNLGINSNKDQLSDPFFPTGRGYKLIVPKSFNAL